MSRPRPLTAADIPGAMRLSQSAGWNQLEQDWRRAIELEPEGCFGIELDGLLVSTVTSICYGRDLAWIGMVLTAPEYRGRGLARQSVERALALLDARGAACVKLDATPMGNPLYRKLGFVEERPIERWLLPAAHGAVPPELDAYEPDASRDFDAFGADRGRLLARLEALEAASVRGCGYAMGRPGRNAAYFGPCVAGDAAAARRLAEWFLGRHADEPVYWDLLPENREAARLARSFGFAPHRELVRMTRGSGRAPAAPDQVYAIAGFEFG